MRTVADLASEPFVSVTTFRRSGEGVPTPVWVVPDDDGFAVWTAADSGKAKRLRRDPHVELAACSRRGSVADDADRVTGVATVTDDPAVLDAVRADLARKYGVQYRLIVGIETVISLVKRRPSRRVVLRVRPDA